MPWGAAIGAVGAIAGGLIASNGAKNAANTQSDATKQANDTQLQMYNQTRTDNLPALGARNDALSRLEELLGVGGNSKASGYGSLGGALNVGDVTKDPGYQFGFNQGQTALNNSLTAHGMRDSGAALKAAARYGTDYATTKYDDAFNRAQTNRQLQLNPLQSLAGLGQTGASTIAQAGANTANQIGANQIGLGNAIGASQVAQANLWGNTANQLAGIGAGWYQNRGGNPWSSGSTSMAGNGGYLDANNPAWANYNGG